MNRILGGLGQWSARHRDIWLDFVRMYLGVGLIAKGIAFVSDRALNESVAQTPLAFFEAGLAHVVVMAHVFGGILLALGLLTRIAALVQIPILLGAIAFVHVHEGFFTRSATLEFALLVLFLLVIFAFAGAGTLSLDHRWRIGERDDEDEEHADGRPAARPT